MIISLVALIAVVQVGAAVVGHRHRFGPVVAVAKVSHARNDAELLTQLAVHGRRYQPHLGKRVGD